MYMKIFNCHYLISYFDVSLSLRYGILLNYHLNLMRQEWQIQSNTSRQLNKRKSLLSYIGERYITELSVLVLTLGNPFSRVAEEMNDR